MTPEQLAEIEAADLHSLQADAQHNPDVWTLNRWRQELLAEVKRLRDERARAYSALSDYGRSAVDISGDLEDGINAEHLMASAEREGDATC